MARPTRDDAELLLALANWHTASGVPEAANWIRSKDFVKDFDGFEKRHPNGSKGRLQVNRFLGYHETLGTLWKNHLLSEELLFDWAWIVGPWDLVRDVALGMRKKAGVDALWENFEAMAERQRSLTTGATRRRTPAKKAGARAPAARTSGTRKAAAGTARSRSR
jgi:hypothetical protein